MVVNTHLMTAWRIKNYLNIGLFSQTLQMISIYITCKNKKEAEKIARVLLDRKLIACANMFPIHSAYWWKGKKEQSKEYVMIGKSLEKKFKAIEREVKRIHSYGMPFISASKEKTTAEVERWLRKELKK